LFGGLGGLATQKIEVTRSKAIVAGIVVSLAILLLVYAFFLNFIFFDLLYLSLSVRVILCLVLLAPPCFLAGTLFPLGLEAAALSTKELIPWMWSVNGTAVVLGAATGALISFYIGFRFTLAISAVFYVAAMILFLLVKPAVQAQ
jgi:hypothetical protein